MLQRANLLLLDEPTNHLDIETVHWFEEFLLSYPESVMLISHDRRLIERFAKDILEFAPPKLTLWPGGLKKYESQKAVRIEQLEAQVANQQKEINRLEDFARRFGAKATKARQAQNKRKTAEHYREEMEKLKEDIPQISVRASRFKLKLDKRLPRTALEIKNASFGYENCENLFHLEHALVEGGRKIGVIGVNGVGKSTFLKTCAQEIPLKSGSLRVSDSIKVGYFAQHRLEDLPLHQETFDYLYDQVEGLSITQVRQVAASLGLRETDMDKPIEVLSGGEKARVSLSKILLSRPSLLLLDEPTNPPRFRSL